MRDVIALFGIVAEHQIDFPAPEKSPLAPLTAIYVPVFAQGGREYDYICDLADARPGDSVIVEADGERQTITVTRMYRMAMSDMPLEPGRYRKTLEKVGE